MKTALIWMPPASIEFPSPQIGYLKAFACKHDIHVDDYYLNLFFAELIGIANYRYLSEKDKSRLLEYIFSVELFEDRTTMRCYFNSNRHDNPITKELLEINIAGWLDTAARRLISRKYGLIGFSCTFNQALPSLALAKQIKRKKPDVVVVFGGAELFPSFANEIIKKCPFVDHIVLGQGENALLDIAHNGVAEKIIDMSGRETHLDNLVTPDYDTHFNKCKKWHAKEKTGFQNSGRIIPIMGGRGCWWAEKNRCSFCGGCGDAEQKYFQRTPADVVKEMKVLSKKYKSNFFNFIDAIEPSDFYGSKGLLKLLASLDEEYTIFHQVRAPGNQRSFEMLDAANIRIIQPGLESLDSNILKLMRKGITARDVLRCLYWSKVYNIEVSWNILVGHPGERIEWVHNIANIIPKIHHLPPPTLLLYVQIQRRSPIFESIIKSQNEASPVKIIPDSRLRYLYPQDWNYQNLSYEFENPYEMSGELKEAHKELDTLVSRWCNLWESNSKPAFYVDKTDNEWKIYDTRSQCCREYNLKGKELEVSKQLVADTDKEAIFENYSKYQAEIGSLIDKEIVVSLDGCLIWLPTFSDEMKEDVY